VTVQSVATTKVGCGTVTPATYTTLQKAVDCAKNGTGNTLTGLTQIQFKGACTGPVTVVNRSNLLIIGLPSAATTIVSPTACAMPNATNPLPVVKGNGLAPVIRISGGVDVFVSQINVVSGGDGIEYDTGAASTTDVSQSGEIPTVTCSCLGSNSRSGLEAESSVGISAEANRATTNRNDGIFFDGTIGGVVFNNEAANNHDRGIEVIRGATDSIHDNNAHDNGDDGIKLAATDSFCVHNTSTKNLGDGIDIRHGARNRIEDNTADMNMGAGIRLSLTNKAIVTNNEASANTIAQVLLEGTKDAFVDANKIPALTDKVSCAGGNSLPTGSNVPATCP